MKPLAQNTLIQNRYLIVHLIGKGGMGEVYLAVDQRLGSAVALKRTFFAGDEMLSNAFEREARILARMRHPVLPKVSDHFSEGEEQYLVMEHISGDDLAKRLEAAQKPFPLSWVMFWADQLLDALSYLHSHEPPIIHRDIKPQNLKLTDENHVILLDFGLSKNSTGQTKISDSGSSTGSVVGYTPHYAPMEQIRGIGTSPRSDLYSLSATLYQLLTNQVPPDALSRADVMLNGSPDPIESPSSYNPEVPSAVSVVLLKGMEVSQDKRYESAREMQKALRKAYAQMQDVMAAQTVVMSAEGTSVADSVPVEAPSMDKTEVMDFNAVPAAVIAGGVAGAISSAEAPTNIISQPTSPAVDPNATMFDVAANESMPLQSDVKTEVFLAGSTSMPTPPYQDGAPPAGGSTPSVDEVHEFTPETNNGGGDFDDIPSAPVDATMPIIAFDKAIDSAPASEDTNYYGEAYTSEASSPSGFEAAAATADSLPAEAVQPAYAAAAPAKKRSGGKIFAVVLGVFALFILGAAALGGGYYYYANYYSAAVEPEPSPSASPSVEPTAEPTIDQANSSVTDDNSNTTASTDGNSNSNSKDDLTVAPTPASEPVSTPSDTVAVRPTPGTTTKATPGKTKPVDKPTPKPTSTRDKKVILQ